MHLPVPFVIALLRQGNPRHYDCQRNRWQDSVSHIKKLFHHERHEEHEEEKRFSRKGAKTRTSEICFKSHFFTGGFAPWREFFFFMPLVSSFESGFGIPPLSSRQGEEIRSLSPRQGKSLP